MTSFGSAIAGALGNGSVPLAVVDQSAPVDDGGLGTYLRTIRTYTPLGTSADAANIQVLIDDSVVREIVVQPGTATINSNIRLRGGLLIRGAGVGKTRIVSSITNQGHTSSNPDDKLFYAAAAYGSAGTLHDTPTLLGVTFTSTTVMAVGTWALVSKAGANGYVQLFQIKARSGSSGTITYTVDRPIRRAFTSGDAVTPVATTVENAWVENMELSGTGVRALCFLQTIRSGWRDILVTPDDSGGVFTEGGSLDTGNFDCEIARAHAYGVGGHAWSMESSERTRAIGSGGDGCTNYGINVLDGIDNVIEVPIGSKNAGLVFVGTQPGLTVGCLDTTIVGGASTGDAFGVQIARSVGTTVKGFGSESATTYGIQIVGDDSTTGRAFDVTIVGGVHRNSNTSGAASAGGIAIKNALGVSVNGVVIDTPSHCGTFLDTGVSDLTGNIGLIRNVQTANGRNVGVLVGGASATGRIAGLYVDTATSGVRYDAVALGLAIDNWTAANVSARSTSPENGTVDGIRLKADGATTVDVSGGVRVVRCADTGATTITNPMVNAEDLQQVVYVATNANTTVNRSNAALTGSANWVSNQYGALGLIFRTNVNLACEEFRATTNG
jgi:hypothetical protein